MALKIALIRQNLPISLESIIQPHQALPGRNIGVKLSDSSGPLPVVPRFTLGDESSSCWGCHGRIRQISVVVSFSFALYRAGCEDSASLSFLNPSHFQVHVWTGKESPCETVFICFLLQNSCAVENQQGGLWLCYSLGLSILEKWPVAVNMCQQQYSI